MDYEKALILLSVAEKALHFGPKFKFVHDKALEALEKINDDPEPESTIEEPAAELQRALTRR